MPNKVQQVCVDVLVGFEAITNMREEADSDPQRGMG